MGLESVKIDLWLADFLSTDATLPTLGTPPLNQNTLGGAAMRLYDTEPPQSGSGQSVVYPILVFQSQSVLSDHSFDRRMGVMSVYLIKVIGRAGADWVDMATIIDRVDERLAGTPVEFNGWRFTMVPSDEQVIKFVEPDPGGPRRRHLGRLYQIAAEAV